MIFNGKQNILTKEQMDKLEIGVSVFNDDNCNPILYKKAWIKSDICKSSDYRAKINDYSKSITCDKIVLQE